MNFVLEFFTTVLGHQLEEPMLNDINYFNPYSSPRVLDPKAAPTHYTTEGGGTYSARPDLTRPAGPGAYVTMGAFSLGIVVIYSSAVIHESYAVVIDDEDDYQQRAAWQVYISALTGTFGIGSAGSQYV